MFDLNKKMLLGIFLLTFFLLIIGNVSASDNNITSDSTLLNQIDDSNPDKIELDNINEVELNSVSNEEYLKSSSDEVIINPNFDDGLDNWTSSGTVQVMTGQDGNGIYMKASRGDSSISQSVDLTNVESIGFYYKVNTYVAGSSSFIVSAGDASESFDLSVSDWTYGELDTSSVSDLADLKFTLTETGTRPAIILIDTIFPNIKDDTIFIINPNFDDGLDNWTSSGTVQVMTGQDGNGIYMKVSRGDSSISQSVDLTNVESIGFYYKVNTYVAGSSSFIVSAGDASESFDLSVSDWTYGELDTSSVSDLADLKFTLTETGTRPAIILIDTIAAHTNTFVLTVDFISNVTVGMDELEVQFNGTSNGNVIEWLWDFGDGETAAGQNVTHKYSKIGSYDVTLKTWYADNPNSTLTKNNYINVYHTNSIIINPDFENATIQKTNEYYNVTDGSYLVTRYFDGWISTGGVYPVNQGVSPKSGNYVLYLRGETASIRPDPNQSWMTKITGQPSVSQKLNFDYIDSISFYVLSSSVGLNVTVGDVYLEQVNLVNPNSGKGEWQLVTIDTSDKSIFKGEQLFKITFSELITLDNYIAVPTVYIDAFSCTYSDLTHSNFTYSIDSITNRYFNVQFNNEAYGSITSFFWDFGDGTNSTEINPMHSFKPGTYNVKLTASNVNHTDEYSYTLVLEDFPTIGNIIYKSIQDAIDNADEGDVIDITKDLSENIIIDKDLTLNFNGNKLTGTGSSPVIQVTGGAQATIKNITFEDSTVLSTDDESSLTVTESNIADTNITLSTGNIALDGNNFNGSFITITNANAVIANNNVTNAGIKVNGGKSKINNNVLSGNDVAITQTAGETDIISNLITNNAVGVNITGGNANVNFNALYDNTNVSLAYVGTVNADNNWFGVEMLKFSNTVLDGYVDIYAPSAEQPAWLILTLNTKETELYTTQNYTITVDLTFSNIGNTSALGKLPKLVLPVTTEIGESSTTVTVKDGIGEFTLTTGNSPSDDITFLIKGKEYTLNDTSIVANILETTLTIESLEDGIVIITLKDVNGNVISDADVNYTVNSNSQVTEKTVNGKITIDGLKGTVTITAEYAGLTEYPYYNSTTASETFHFSKITPTIIATGSSVGENETATVSVNIDDATGIVLVEVSGNKYFAELETGHAIVNIVGLKVGNYTANIKYSGDEKYAEKTATASVNVSEVEDNAISQLKEQLEEAKNNASSLANELKEAQDNATQLNNNLSEANKKVDNLTNELADAKNNATQLNSELVDAKQKAENLTTQLGDAQKQIQTLSADLISTNVAAKDLSIKALDNGNVQVTLKANGVALANKSVDVIINSVVYKGVTGVDGVAKIAVKFASAGTYYATVSFAGDDTYKSSISTSKVVVSKKATKITAPKKSFKAKVKTKKVKITLKSGSTVLKSKKITLKVNGKTYTAKTNSKGVATIKVTKLTKKGTFKYTVKFAGDKVYKAITKKGKIIIK